MKENWLWKRNELKDLECKFCGKDLLHPLEGNLIMVYQFPKEEGVIYPRKVFDVYSTCKTPECNQMSQHMARQNKCTDGWRDISDFLIPEALCSYMLSIVEGLYKGQAVWETEAIEEMMRFIIMMFMQLEKKVKLSPKQREHLELLHSMPRF